MNVVLLFLLLAACSGRATAKAPVYTHVTYLYDIKRGGLANGRSLDYYLSQFEKQLKSDSNMIIYGQKQMAQFVWQRRKQHNTVFIERPLTQFKKYWFSPILQNLRQEKNANPNFIGRGYAQFALQYYNLLMMSKLFVMLESLKHDKFNTDILIWVDAGYTHIFSQKWNVFSPQNIVKKYYELLQPQWVLFCYGKSGFVIQGFAQGATRYIGRQLQSSELVLAGQQGGYIQIVKDMKSAFENFLKITLEFKDLNSDEAVVSMMPIKFPYLIPTTTTFYLDKFPEKINIYENVNRKPLHSRSFGCQFGSDNIQINFDYPISKANILGSNSADLLEIKRKPISIEGQRLNINQQQPKSTRIINVKNIPIKKLDTVKQQFYLHLIIMAVLLVSYSFIQSLKRSPIYAQYQMLKSQKISFRMSYFTERF